MTSYCILPVRWADLLDVPDTMISLSHLFLLAMTITLLQVVDSPKFSSYFKTTKLWVSYSCFQLCVTLYVICMSVCLSVIVFIISILTNWLSWMIVAYLKNVVFSLCISSYMYVAILNTHYALYVFNKCISWTCNLFPFIISFGYNILLSWWCTFGVLM